MAPSSDSDTPDSAAAPADRYERRRRRNREALLEAAIALFQRQGVRATKLEEICAQAEVSPRTFFNHFETREHLFRAIADQRVAQLATLLEARRDDPADFAARLTRLLDEIAAYLTARPAYRELVGEMLTLRVDLVDGAERSAAATLASAALRFVEQGVARGELTRRHPPEVLADLLIAAVTTALAHWCADAQYDLAGRLGQSARALLDGFQGELRP